MPPASVTPEHRRIAKAINFGLAFGQTDFGLAQVLRIPRAQARTYIQSYFARYAGVKAYMDRTIVEARETAEVVDTARAAAAVTGDPGDARAGSRLRRAHRAQHARSRGRRPIC